MWPILQYIPCLHCEIVPLPDSADCDVLLLRNLFNCFLWVFFVAHFHLDLFELFLLIIASLPWFCTFVLCALDLDSPMLGSRLPRCYLATRPASNLCPSAGASTAHASLTPSGLPIVCSSVASVDPIHTPYHHLASDLLICTTFGSLYMIRSPNPRPRCRGGSSPDSLDCCETFVQRIFSRTIAFKQHTRSATDISFVKGYAWP